MSDDSDHALPGVEGVIAAAAIRAPSAGTRNRGPSRLDLIGWSLRLAPEHTSTMDVGLRGSAVALGAALFNARVAAAAQQVLGPVRWSNVDGVPLQAALLRHGEDPDLAALYEAMLARGANRSKGTGIPIQSRTFELLSAVAEREGAGLQMVTERNKIDELATLLGAADRIRYLTPRLHAEMIGELRWPGSPCADTGIDVLSLGLDPGEVALIEILKRPDVMTCLAQWHAGSALGEDTRIRVSNSSALAVISVPGSALIDFACGGSAVEAVWIAAEQCGLAVQPISPVFLYAQDAEDLSELSLSFAIELGVPQSRFRQLVGLAAGVVPALVLRFAQSGRLRYEAAAVSAGSVRGSADTVYRIGMSGSAG